MNRISVEVVAMYYCWLKFVSETRYQELFSSFKQWFPFPRTWSGSGYDTATHICSLLTGRLPYNLKFNNLFYQKLSLHHGGYSNSLIVFTKIATQHSADGGADGEDGDGGS
jgi:hypothetical protein